MILEYDCKACMGQGEVDDSPCRNCSGYGSFPTAAGKDLIDFLQRRGVFFPMSPLAEDELRGIAEGG